MTAAIKRMLAEKAQLAAKPVVDHGLEERAIDSVMEAIDLAAPFIDEERPPDRWRPSWRLKMGFFILATGPGGHNSGVRFVQGMLDRSRDQYKRGEHPNPFAPRLSGGAVL